MSAISPLIRYCVPLNLNNSHSINQRSTLIKSAPLSDVRE